MLAFQKSTKVNNLTEKYLLMTAKLYAGTVAVCGGQLARHSTASRVGIAVNEPYWLGTTEQKILTIKLRRQMGDL